MSRADEIARGLVAHLRGVLGEPGLELAEPAAPLTGGFDTEIHAVRLRGAPPASPGRSCSACCARTTIPRW